MTERHEGSAPISGVSHVQLVVTDLGVSRADISFGYTMNMLGFFAGGVVADDRVDVVGRAEGLADPAELRQATLDSVASAGFGLLIAAIALGRVHGTGILARGHVRPVPHCSHHVPLPSGSASPPRWRAQHLRFYRAFPTHLAKSVQPQHD